MLEKMKEIIADQLSVDADTITEASKFKEDLGADSLDLFELVLGQMMINPSTFYYFFKSFHSISKQRNKKGNKNRIVLAAFMFYTKLM